jgi:uncharacterized membrane protein HdeD (DUF308 family)
VSTRNGLRGPGYLTVAKDIVATGTGAFAIVWMTLTGRVSPWLVGFAGLALGVQGIGAAITAVRETRDTGTRSSPSPSPESDSSSLPF